MNMVLNCSTAIFGDVAFGYCKLAVMTAAATDAIAAVLRIAIPAFTCRTVLRITSAHEITCLIIQYFFQAQNV